ncbi:RNA polymerase sigma factor [Paenibacillus sp. J31TS4]|uniref:RNA polymerase sigma factor n=1 Tax=Paenibacillus sp. J31TS4 TaxID=2807195 RepID=UPI001B150E10|nr:RNA polymerase sigma factor [Paenibacillus sp. J31TS4]GIP38489.1 RNA polymerase sigma factor [Paenibacillus sp. J31TS4]
MTDEELMKEWAAGGEAAMDALIHRHHQPLLGYLYRMTGSRPLAEDLAQDAFLAVFRQASAGFVPERFKPWLYKIALNRCRDHWKKAATQRETAQADSAALEEREAGGLMDLTHRQVERQWMTEALEQLPESYRTVVVLRFYQDLSYAEIAEAAGLPLNTIKTRLLRGLRQLQTILEDSMSEDESFGKNRKDRTDTMNRKAGASAGRRRGE